MGIDESDICDRRARKINDARRRLALEAQGCPPNHQRVAVRSRSAFIARLNIKRYHDRLTQDIDDATRAMLKRLLAEEEAKLKVLLDDLPSGS